MGGRCRSERATPVCGRPPYRAVRHGLQVHRRSYLGAGVQERDQLLLLVRQMRLQLRREAFDLAAGRAGIGVLVAHDPAQVLDQFGDPVVLGPQPGQRGCELGVAVLQVREHGGALAGGGV